MAVNKWTFSVIIYVCVFIIIVGADNTIVDYYERIIKDGIEKSSRYILPKDASAYKAENAGHPVYFGTFDYIIVGGGSAGAVVASRLSEIAKWNILLLEAGEEENDFTDIPAMSPYTLASEYNWGFNTTQQSTCCLATNGICSYPRGKALGGSTVINSLVYSRGNPLDYDKWAEEGNPGWSYKDVLPFFIKSENCSISGDAGYHGNEGYLNVEHHTPLSDRARAFINANLEKGLPEGDYNGKWQLKTAPTQFTTQNGKRLSAAKAFLQPANRRTNLRILTGSYATRIVISGKLRRARGVVFSNKNVEYYAKVGKELVLSAGVFGSPHLLMLSGIGPAQHLEELQLPVQVNLDVGKTMHDHLTFYNLYFTTSQVEPTYTIRDAIRQYVQGVGPLTISTNPQAISFHVLSHRPIPDLEVVIVPTTSKSHVFQIVLVLLHPKTRGSVSLRSSNPYDYPLIDAQCLSDPENEDIEKILRGIELVMELTRTEAFKKLRPNLVRYEPCSHNRFLSREYWVCVIWQTSMNAYHAGGTCRMGPNPLKGDVVDNELKVYGVTNLRVADASVVPVTLSAHMSAPTMMIGEKLADLIKRG